MSNKVKNYDKHERKTTLRKVVIIKRLCLTVIYLLLVNMKPCVNTYEHTLLSSNHTLLGGYRLRQRHHHLSHLFIYVLLQLRIKVGMAPFRSCSSSH